MTGEWSRRAVLAGAGGLALAQTAQAAQAPPPPGVVREDPALDALIDPNAQVERIMTGFSWSEGPVWIGGRDGYLLVSDPRDNVIRRWSPRDGESEFLKPSGYAGPPSGSLREPGTNGLILGGRNTILAADSGNRGIARIDLRTRNKTMLCSRFEGKRFNSCNDLVMARDGSIYFTDPAHGLHGGLESPVRELDFTGVFRLAPNGEVTVIDRTLTQPNGIALSRDGRTLYATSQGLGWVSWTLDAQGRPSERRAFVDTQATGIVGGDGMKFDADGNLWATGRDGVNVFAPDGRRIGIVRTGSGVANCEFGADGYLYIAAASSVARVPVKARKLMVI